LVRFMFSKGCHCLCQASAADLPSPAKTDRQTSYAGTNGMQLQTIADYARATVNGKFTLAYYNRGLAHERLGDNATAVNDYRRVLALDSTAQSARLRLERLLSG
jgi:hypothetical protein